MTKNLHLVTIFIKDRDYEKIFSHNKLFDHDYKSINSHDKVINRDKNHTLCLVTVNYDHEVKSLYGHNHLQIVTNTFFPHLLL